jgi:carbon-monoxide dehydrogenase medium subunit
VQAKIRRIHYPRNAGELSALLKKGRGRVAPVGGGVSFSFSVPPKVTELASLRALGLDAVTLDRKGLGLGVLVTVAGLAVSAPARKFLGGLLAETAAKVAATPNRNLITVGGNAMRLFIWSDLPVVYAVAGAVFTVRGEHGARHIPADRFYESQPALMLRPSEFLEKISIPAPPPRTGAAFEKFGETENTFALVSAAAVVTLDRAGRCASARLALGGLRLLPRVSGKAAAVLAGLPPSPARMGVAAAEAVEEAGAVRDIRVSAEYKKRLAAVVGRRAIERAFAAARGGKGKGR